MANKNNHPYEDIIDLPHHVSATRPQMPMEDRAAQFSPFAALTGYDSAIKETSRLTDRKIELDESEIEALNQKLQSIADHIGTDYEVTITYFVPDSKKDGGAYLAAHGVVEKIDEYERIITLCDGRQIRINDVLDIQIGVAESVANGTIQ